MQVILKFWLNFCSTQRLFTIYQKLLENPVKRQKEHIFLHRSRENVQEYLSIWKGSPVFLEGKFQMEIWGSIC